MQNIAVRILRQMRIEMHQSSRRVTDQSARRTPSRDRWKGAGGVKKPHRYRPGTVPTVAFREIRRQRCHS